MGGGLPLNMEIILRRLVEKYDDNVNPLEWALALRTVNRIIEEAEDAQPSKSSTPP